MFSCSDSFYCRVVFVSVYFYNLIFLSPIFSATLERKSQFRAFATQVQRLLITQFFQHPRLCCLSGAKSFSTVFFFPFPTKVRFSLRADADGAQERARRTVFYEPRLLKRIMRKVFPSLRFWRGRFSFLFCLKRAVKCFNFFPPWGR